MLTLWLIGSRERWEKKSSSYCNNIFYSRRIMTYERGHGCSNPLDISWWTKQLYLWSPFEKNLNAIFLFKSSNVKNLFFAIKIFLRFVECSLFFWAWYNTRNNISNSSCLLFYYFCNIINMLKYIQGKIFFWIFFFTSQTFWNTSKEKYSFKIFFHRKTGNYFFFLS